jgi:polyphenol oxidase
MVKTQTNGINIWQFENLGIFKGINHFVSDRVLPENGSEFTLSFSSSPDREEIRRNRRRLAEALGIHEDSLIFPSQVHKTRIVHVTHGISKQDLMETDALITNERGLCLAVMSADCVPILMYDEANGAVAAIHSGWRGTVAKILEKTLHAMHERYGTRGEDVIAGVGPSVCQDSYEVGEEVVESVKGSFKNASELLVATSPGKAKLDLWKANKVQLLDFGVKENRIEISDLCTVKNNEYFFSARKGDAGRFAAGIMLR